MGKTPAQALLLELKSSTRGVTDPRFQRIDLLELLLAQSRDALPARPDQAVTFADLAITIAAHSEGLEAARSVTIEAHCLSANAYRLIRLFHLAEKTLASAAGLLDLTSTDGEFHRALYCRTLALVRWEQGRLDEALSLLKQAWFLIPESDSEGETACSLLLALLQYEIGYPEGVAAEMRCRFGNPLTSRRPWLASRAMLTLASTAARDDLALAHAALGEGIRLQGQVFDTDEQLRLYALEGRARARLGFTDEAEQMIEGVRRQHLRAKRLSDLTLSSLDLLALRFASRKPSGFEELLRDIEVLGDTLSSSELACAALDRFVSSVAPQDDPWPSQRCAATWYLQSLRFGGSTYLPPLPFA